jgi:hypothetical protein
MVFNMEFTETYSTQIMFILFFISMERDSFKGLYLCFDI